MHMANKALEAKTFQNKVPDIPVFAMPLHLVWSGQQWIGHKGKYHVLTKTMTSWQV